MKNNTRLMEQYVTTGSTATMQNVLRNMELVNGAVKDLLELNTHSSDDEIIDVVHSSILIMQIVEKYNLYSKPDTLRLVKSLLEVEGHTNTVVLLDLCNVFYKDCLTS